MQKKQTRLASRFLPFETYLQMARDAAKERTIMYRHAYLINEGGEKVDDTENGNLSCAYFISGMLYMQKFINDMHLTIKGLKKDVLNRGYILIDEPKTGAIIFWGPEGPRNTRHVGICNGTKKLVFNGSAGSFYIEEATKRGEDSQNGVRVFYNPKNDIYCHGDVIFLETVISNNDKIRSPIIHNIDYTGLFGRIEPRVIEGIYWNPEWDNSA